MDLIELLSRAQGGTMRSAGAQFGLDEEQTRMAFEALAPVVASGIRRNAESGDGMVALVEALNRGSHDRYLDDDEAVQFDNVRDEGNAILGHVFGSPDVSRGVAAQAAQETGIGGDILKKMLPVIAGMVMAGLAKSMFGGRGSPSASGQETQGDILGDILGGGQGQQGPQPGRQGPGGLDDLLRDVLGGGASRAPGGQGGGLGDILGDILGGGAREPGVERPQPSDESLQRGRDVLGDALGRGTSRGNAADDLLNSVERHLGRR